MLPPTLFSFKLDSLYDVYPLFNINSVKLLQQVHLSMLFLEFLLTNTPYNFVIKPLAAFPFNNHPNNLPVEMNPVARTIINPFEEIGRAGDQTTDLLI